MMKAAIIEDEPLAIAELENLLGEVAPDVRIVARLDSVAESVRWLRDNSADLLFMDIHLGDGQSFDIFEEVKITAPVIFITAYDEYALKAFKFQGVDYILKPFDREELRRALRKVATLAAAGEPLPPAVTSYQERFLVSLGAKMKSVAADDVAYFMADGKYLLLFTRDGQNYILDSTISAIEGKLNPARFFKVSRKFIISYSSIREMVRYSNSRVRIHLSPSPPDGVEVVVSADRLPDFKRWLNN